LYPNACPLISRILFEVCSSKVFIIIDAPPKVWHNALKLTFYMMHYKRFENFGGCFFNFKYWDKKVARNNFKIRVKATLQVEFMIMP
jgi:hypothetical protein